MIVDSCSESNKNLIDPLSIFIANRKNKKECCSWSYVNFKQRWEKKTSQSYVRIIAIIFSLFKKCFKHNYFLIVFRSLFLRTLITSRLKRSTMEKKETKPKQQERNPMCVNPKSAAFYLMIFVGLACLVHSLYNMFDYNSRYDRITKYLLSPRFLCYSLFFPLLDTTTMLQSGMKSTTSHSWTPSSLTRWTIKLAPSLLLLLERSHSNSSRTSATAPAILPRAVSMPLASSISLPWNWLELRRLLWAPTERRSSPTNSPTPLPRPSPFLTWTAIMRGIVCGFFWFL